MKLAVLGCALMALLLCTSRAASPLLFDGFETYNRGTLDANSPSDTNTAPNGGPGNPWWGTYPPDLRVVGQETNTNTGISTNLVTPHGGTNMVRGIHSGAVDRDWNYFNLAYRLNNSRIFSGNVSLDWWFFDPVGAKTNSNAAPQYQDFVSLAYDTIIPTNSDYYTNIDGSVDPGFATTQISLGASTNQTTGYKSTNYQAQILHTTSTNAYDTNNGWFNLPVTRSVGWHHGRIVVSTPGANAITPVSFFIDNLTNAVLSTSAALTNGLNCIALECENGNLTGYYDDLTFDVFVPPTLGISIAGTNAIVTWAVTGWILQSSTNLVSSNFADISNAVSPYTNSLAAPPRFFRLRQ